MPVPPDFYKKMREQYKFIKDQNLQTVTFVKDTPLTSGDFFHETETRTTTTKDIEVNIQAVNEDDMKLMELGYLEVAEWKCYAEWDQVSDIDKYDYAIFQGKRYKVVNTNRKYFQGQPIFYSFMLQRVG